MIKQLSLGFFLLVRDSIRQWRFNQLSRQAAALAYYLALLLGPLLVMLTVLVGLVIGPRAAQADIFTPLQRLLGTEAASTIATMVASIEKPRAGAFAGVASILLFFFGAAGAFEQLKEALNAVWKTPWRLRGGILAVLRKRFIAVLFVAGTAILILVLLAATTLISEANSFIAGFAPILGRGLNEIDIGVSFAAVTLVFGVTYKILPDTAVQWRDVWLGAACAAILFIVGQFVLSIFLARAETMSAYGAATAMVVVLLWLYYSAQIYLFGAAFTRAYAVRFGSRSRRRAEGAGAAQASS